MSVKKLHEAATIKGRARAAMRALRGLLEEKELSKTLRGQVEELQAALGKTWSELADDATLDPVESFQEAANVGQWFEGFIHQQFTMAADDRFMYGLLTREERIGLSSAIGAALDAFVSRLTEVAPQLYGRAPGMEPEEGLPVEGVEVDEGVGSETRSCGFEEEGMALVEGLRKDGSVRVKLIQPGWGSSGYYPAEVLERDGPRVFTPGVKMFWDHPTREEESARPEGSLRNLAAELTSAAQWEAQGQAGAGLYADAIVFEPFRQAVAELGSHIGVSIRASGKGAPGIVEGKKGLVIGEISGARSVDFVTMPGAGGKVVSLFEAARGGAVSGQEGLTSLLQNEEDEMEELEEAKRQNEEMKAQLAALQEQALAREAGDMAAVMLGKVDLPEAARSRALREVVNEYRLSGCVVEGKIDEAKLKELVDAKANEEKTYVESLRVRAGGVQGMGSSQQAASGDPQSTEQALTEAFKGMGMDEKRAKVAAGGR